MTEDITRYLHRPRKHYVGARLQQGRIVTDADFNEGFLLHAEDRRRTVLSLVGANASPNQGFSIGAPIVNPADPVPLLKPGPLAPVIVRLGETELQVRPVSVRKGSFYLGGERLDLEAPEPIAFQRDFLQMRPEDIEHVDEQPDLDPDALGTVFRDLYYLHAWDQPVSALEDPEILETALGGETTSTRVRRMRRVEVLGGLDAKVTNTRTAWRRLIRKLQTDNARLNRQTGELVSLGRLQLVVREDDEKQSCRRCNLDPGGRFLGFDNQALRIMLTSQRTFVWALGNSARLHRVTVSGLEADEPTEVTVRIHAPFPDEAHWPLVNRVVEFLPFSALLNVTRPDEPLPPHFAKIAADIGAFTRVLRPYDPNTGTFTIDLGVGLGALKELIFQWDEAHPAVVSGELENGTPGERHFYVRLWHEAPTVNDVELPVIDSEGLARGADVLADTNVIPVFRTLGRRGDYWVAALRPGAPEEVVPFNLAHRPEGVQPTGPRHFYAPLSLIEGTVTPDETDPTVIDTTEVTSVGDARPQIRRLSDNGCVTFTVGDGVQSFGDFTSIQEAIDSLPEDGGVVSVRPGLYRERIVINNRRGISIEGCGEATVLETPLEPPAIPEDPDEVRDPGAIIRIDKLPLDADLTQDISITGLTLRSVERHGILVRGAERVTLTSLAILAGVRVGGRFRTGTANSAVPLLEIVDSTKVTVQKVVLEPVVRPGLAIHGSGEILVSELTGVGRARSRFAPRTALLSAFAFDPAFSRSRAARPAMVIIQGSLEGAVHEITIRESILSAFGQAGVLVSGRDFNQVFDIRLENLSIFTGRNIASQSGAITASQSGVSIEFGQRVSLEDSSIVMEASLSEHAAVVVGGTDLRVHGNRIEALTRCFDVPRRPLSSCRDERALAWGGLQIRGSTSRADVRGNHIVSGVGHGITLGSVIWRHRVSAEELLSLHEGAGRGQLVIRSDGTRVVSGVVPPSFRLRQRRYRARDEGALSEVFIAENRIERMFTNGISVLSVLGLPDESFIDLERCRIEQNTIVGNLLRPAATVPNRGELLPFDSTRHGTAGSGSLIPVLPFGGIVLATVTKGIEIRGNVVAGNGTSGNLPINGIFVLNGDSIVIRDNRITGNGGRASATVAPRPGIRAGIAVMLAGNGATTETELEIASRSPVSPSPRTGFDSSSLRVLNNSVLHPEGRALHAVATGPVSIDGNSFGSLGNHGSNTTADLFAVGEIIFVMNVGPPWENEAPVFSPYVTPPGTRTYLENTAAQESPTEEQRRSVGHGGGVLFNHNQVTLDWFLQRIPVRRLNAPISFFPVALLALDHLGVEGNQFAFRLRGLTPRSRFAIPVRGYTEPVFSHALMIGATIQAGGNRFAESVKKTILSLLAIAELMHITTYNQSTHRIFVTASNVLGMASPDVELDSPTLGHGFGDVALSGDDFSVPDGVSGSEVIPIERVGNQVMFSANNINADKTLPTLRSVSRLFLELLLDRG